MADSNIGKGVSFIGVLQLIFIVLKLTKLVSWQWWKVLDPTWVPVAFVILIILTIAWVELLSRKL